MDSLEAFQEQFRRLKEVEEGKDQLVEKLISRVRELEACLREEKLHLEREQETTKVFQAKFCDVDVKFRKLDKEIVSNSFVSVLIDGDCMKFSDDLVKSMEKGGIEAVRRLKSRVCEYVSKKLELPSHILIRVRIYANVKGLASAYCHSKILDSADDLHLFIRGFNMGYPMCDFVDSGDGKECADSKLKVWFNHDMADVQCQAVLFGGSADNGYARLLLPYVGDESKSSRIVLVEGLPFAKELAVLKDKFLVTRFPDIFRNAKLPSQRLSISSTPPPAPTPSATGQATEIPNPFAAALLRIASAQHTPVAIPARKEYPVLRNSKGQRLDAIINPSQSLVNAMSSKKYCNSFHILGQCTHADCAFLHGVRLDEKGIEARRLLLRRTPCSTGLRCKDEKCLFGHHCPDAGCTKSGTSCRFSKAMHSVNRK